MALCATAAIVGLTGTRMAVAQSDQPAASEGTGLEELVEFTALVLHFCENQMLNGECIRLDGGLRMRGDLHAVDCQET